jgi:hypothetical protein
MHRSNDQGSEESKAQQKTSNGKPYRKLSQSIEDSTEGTSSQGEDKSH